jgi:AcrR family transcriptional regulator
MAEIRKAGKGQGNRDRIIEAAFKLFYHKGFNQTSFTDIAQASDFPRGNFYYYFKSKDELLSEVVKQMIERTRASVAAIDTAIADPAERILKIVDLMEAMRDEVVQFGCPMGTLVSELGKTQKSMQKKAAHMFDVLIDWMADQLDALGYGDRSRILAMHVIGRMQGVATIAYTYTDAAFMDHEIEGIREELIRLAQRETL